MDPKPWYKSKVMLANLLAIALGTADQVASTGLLGEHGGTVAQVVGVGNMLLRAFTTQPIGAAK